MGNNCSCLSDITSLCTEDLSRKGNSDGMNQLINNNPKIDLANAEKCGKMMLNKNSTIDALSVNSNQIASTLNSNNNNNYGFNKNINNKNIKNKNRKNDNNRKEEKIIFEQKTISQTGAQPTIEINSKLQKYFLKVVKKKCFIKNIKKYKKEGDNLFKLCSQKIYASNERLSKAEQSCKIKYDKNGYKDFYPNITPEEELNMKYIPTQSKTIDNSVTINYQNQNQEKDPSKKNDKNFINWIYKGQANINNIPNGFGVKYTKNGTKQEGYWKEGQLYGWSQSIDSQGNILMGPFKDGKLTGKGVKYSFLNNTFYKGEIVDNKKEGKGEEISGEGIFSGNFLNDKKNGEGKMEYSLSGDTYEGNYKDDLFDGKGHYLWKISGQEYTGEYKNGLMHGKGLYEWSEGEYYRGDFVNGKKEGSGEMHWANGRSFIGPFVNGRPQGIGIFDNGMNYKGEMEFIDGKLNREYLNKKYRGSESGSLASSVDRNDTFL